MALGRRQILGPHGPVGVAEAPEERRVTQVLCRKVVQAVSLNDGVLLEHLKASRRRHKASLQIDDGTAPRQIKRVGADAVIAAGGVEERPLQGGLRQKCLNRIGLYAVAHGIPVMPRLLNVPSWTS